MPMPMPRIPAISRNMVIAVGVLLFHAAALWALQAGLLRRAAEIIVPAEILSELMEPPAPKAPPPPPSMPALPIQQAVAPAPMPPAPPAPPPQAIQDAAPAPNAPVVSAAASPAPAVLTTPATTSAPPRLELPSSNAEYLQNPKPPYPPMSKRLGEQGKVVVRVLIGVDGSAQQAQIRQSSGFDRLDQTALNTVLHWRYVPGKRGGLAEAMWFDVPINFVLE